MRRVVITGMGIVSSIGNTANAVAQALRAGKSGITFSPEFAELGFRCQVQAMPEIDLTGRIDKRIARFMADASKWCWIAAEEAIQDAALPADMLSNIRTGLIVGSGGPSTRELVRAADVARSKGPKRVGPFAVPKAMSSTTSATLSTGLKIKGMSYSISSACTTSLHCIGDAAQQIMWGTQDTMIAGGGEELDWTQSVMFDAMGAMSSKYNDTPELASRAFDANRDGFVIAGGAGIVILEERQQALARGANIHAEITGYAATSDGHDMVAPSGEGAERAMRLAMGQSQAPIDYINPHATSTPAGDGTEIAAIRRVFGETDMPAISATKSMTGHSLGGAGAQEAIYALLMMKHGFIAPSINIETIDPEIDGANIITKTTKAELNSVMSNSFGFGGTNGSVIMTKDVG
ncbi:3-oxoacyl-[acyl-carrier-protein] synthase, KASI [hydrothermal vent metagenome]|uniref:3-oxoacyl-[acyl-carrier-protein] synthase 1 n=1 Tax=hydrothermal vent metagenome TaxID=652676 RepID=A0A3B0RW45_9ZZZZ